MQQAQHDDRQFNRGSMFDIILGTLLFADPEHHQARQGPGALDPGPMKTHGQNNPFMTEAVLNALLCGQQRIAMTAAAKHFGAAVPTDRFINGQFNDAINQRKYQRTQDAGQLQ